MKPFLLRAFVAVALLSGLSACAGGGSIPSPNVRSLQTHNTITVTHLDQMLTPANLPLRTPPPPMRPSDPIALLHKPTIAIHNITLPIMATAHDAAYFQRLRESAAKRSSGIRPMTYYTNEGGQQGMIINQGYDDIYGNITAYTNWNNQWQLPVPSYGCAIALGGMGCANNIAANLHGGTDPSTGTDNCLEAGTAFYETTGGGATNAIFWIGDFCNTNSGEIESFPIQANMDQTFSTQYITNLGDGFPRITVELYQPLGDNLWHAILYNYYYNRWDDWYSTNGNMATSSSASLTLRNGWSLDEAHFDNAASTACPTLPTFSVDGIQIAVEPGGGDSNNYFRGLQSSDYYLEGANGCFVSDGTPTPSYNFYTYWDQWNDQAWAATDPVPRPSPSFTPNPPPNRCGTKICY